MAGNPEGDPATNEQPAKPFDQFLKKVSDWKVNVGNLFNKLTRGLKEDQQYKPRLISCKFTWPQTIENVIAALVKIGFTDITNMEFLGRRGSHTMLQNVLDDKVSRLHVYVYIIEKTGYLLVHKEPLPSLNGVDLKYHAFGYLERKMREFLAKITARPGQISINPNERGERGDYEGGTRLFKDLVREKDPVLYQSLDFNPSENDFITFSLVFGNVAKVAPHELLLVEYERNVESSNLHGLINNIYSMLDIIGFPAREKLSIKSKHAFIKAHPFQETEMESVIECFSRVETARDRSFACIFSKNALSKEFITRFMECLHVRGAVYILIITQAPSTRGPVEEDMKKLHKKDIYASFVDLAGFKTLLEKFINNPFSVEDLLYCMRENKVLTKDIIMTLSRESLDAQQATIITDEVLDYLRSNPGWHKTKRVKQEVTRNTTLQNVTEASLDQVLDFLMNPLVGLVNQREGGKEISGIENKEEFKLKRGKMEKFFGNITT
ncbi:MAG: hypothetical protein GYA24_11605 [Candidatus Lokiarchaeota archaeon]|nr:hypothetical protein [Candidatus Lokiarchaeota archaeon]